MRRADPALHEAQRLGAVVRPGPRKTGWWRLAWTGAGAMSAVRTRVMALRSDTGPIRLFAQCWTEAGRTP